MVSTAPPIDPEDLKPIMYMAGLSLHACQQFEYAVKFLLFNIASAGLGSTSVEEAVAIIEDEKKKTLGQLLSLLRQHVAIGAEVSASLEAGLDARNEIAHRFLAENGERMADPATRPAVLVELKRLRKKVLAGDAAVREIVRLVLSLRGIDIDAFTHEFHEELRAPNAKRSES
jgi:hypothetical protein